jgi:hypothetical protein
MDRWNDLQRMVDAIATSRMKPVIDRSPSIRRRTHFYTWRVVRILEKLRLRSSRRPGAEIFWSCHAPTSARSRPGCDQKRASGAPIRAKSNREDLRGTKALKSAASNNVGVKIAKISFASMAYCLWCARRDSNPHDFTHCHLKAARLPIPPRAH